MAQLDVRREVQVPSLVAKRSPEAPLQSGFFHHLLDTRRPDNGSRLGNKASAGARKNLATPRSDFTQPQGNDAAPHGDIIGNENGHTTKKRKRGPANSGSHFKEAVRRLREEKEAEAQMLIAPVSTEFADIKKWLIHDFKGKCKTPLMQASPDQPDIGWAADDALEYNPRKAMVAKVLATPEDWNALENTALRRASEHGTPVMNIRIEFLSFHSAKDHQTEMEETYNGVGDNGVDDQPKVAAARANRDACILCGGEDHKLNKWHKFDEYRKVLSAAKVMTNRNHADYSKSIDFFSKFVCTDRINKAPVHSNKWHWWSIYLQNLRAHNRLNVTDTLERAPWTPAFAERMATAPMDDPMFTNGVVPPSDFSHGAYTVVRLPRDPFWQGKTVGGLMTMMKDGSLNAIMNEQQQEIANRANEAAQNEVCGVMLDGYRQALREDKRRKSTKRRERI
ncbi:hypothetical protein B0T22DRAFT_476133 [Podospora appendiculata]|uniref:Uncharacterized protein n=1 Tax=Podospora appendiculata TaxID=314037 RepID=A0AAE0XHD5_9PEZI|nr:hypothetical protein B0T22DRAFT_476133 [Podospora appendiculata]